MTDVRNPAVVELTFWECGHIEIDQGETHDCGDDREVCSPTYRQVRVVDAVDVNLAMTDREAETVHHALGAVVQLLDEVGDTVPPHAPLYGARESLVLVARRLDHERRHRGALPNPNGPS